MVTLTTVVPGLRSGDLRLLLPLAPTTAAVVAPADGAAAGALRELGSGFARAGVTMVEGGSTPDVVVASAADVDDAAVLGSAQLLLLGSVPAQVLRRLGYASVRVLTLPAATSLELAVPLDDARWARRAVGQRLAGAGRWRRWRALLGVTIASASRRPERMRRSVVTIASREPGQPFPLAAARPLGIPTDARWFVRLGRGDELQRIAFLAAARGGQQPTWAVKMARVGGLVHPFEQDERGLELIARAGPGLAARAPTLLGRGEVAGLAMSVETAAPGDRLADVLRRRGDRALAEVDAVAAWAVDLAVATRRPAAELTPERDRIRSDLGPAWDHLVRVTELVDRLPALSPVLQHNDLGTWNIVTTGASFTVLDWESANPAGLPLWDLVYFLADASAQMARAADRGRWALHVAALLRGETSLSPFVFEWIRRAVGAGGIDPDAVGPIVTLGWLHHGASHLVRTGSLQALAGVGEAERPELATLAELWLGDPRLGPGWTRWR